MLSERLLRFPISLRAFLSFILVLTTVTTMALVGGAMLFYRLPQIGSEAKGSVQRSASEKAQLLEFALGGLEAQLRPVATLVNYSSDEAIKHSLQTLIGQDFSAVYLVGHDGLIRSGAFSSSLDARRYGIAGSDLSRNPLFVAAQSAQSGKSVWSDNYLSAQSGNIVIGVALRLDAWTIVGEIAPEHLRTSVDTIVGRGEDEVLVVDRVGEWIASGSQKYSSAYNLGQLPIVRAAIAGQKKGGQKIDLADGPVFMGSVKLENLGWMFIVTRPAGWANPDIRKTVLLIIGGLCGSLLIGLMLAPVWAHSLSKPLQRLIYHTHRLAEGHYENAETKEVDSRILELESFGKDLQRMADAVYERETALRESEEHYRAIYQVSHDFISINRLSDWVLLDVNQPYLDALGYERAEMVGHTSKELNIWVNPDDRRLFREILQRELKCHDFETLYRTKSGKQIWVLASSTIVNLNGVPCVYSITRDITDRKHALEEITALNASLEERVKDRTRELAARNNDLAETLVSLETAQNRLAENEHRLNSVLAATGEGIWDWDIANGLTRTSARWCELMGVASDEYIYRDEDASKFQIPEEHDALIQAIQKTLSGEGAFHHELPMRRLDGSIIWVLARGNVTERDAEGKPLRMMGSISDITERKLAELALAEAKRQAEAANEELATTLENLRRTQDELIRSEKLSSLGALVAGVSHELNTPIGNAVTLSSTLLDEQKSFSEKMNSGLTRVQLQSYVDSVRHAGLILDRNLHRAAELLGNFKQLAVDQSSLQRRRFDLKEVVHEITLAMGPTVRKTKHTVHDEVPQGLQLDSFPGPLGQVLINLINNALIHAFEEQQSGNIRLKAWELESGWIEFDVCDDGCGISKENLKRIFDPFFTTRLGQGGSGLGLHIVYGLVVDTLGGRIDVNSTLEHGSIFKLRIPVSAPMPKAFMERSPAE